MYRVSLQDWSGEIDFRVAETGAGAVLVAVSMLERIGELCDGDRIVITVDPKDE